MMRIQVSMAGLMLAFAATTQAQWGGSCSSDKMSRSSQDSVLRGQISSDRPLMGSVTVELLTPGHGTPLCSTISTDNYFEFGGMAPGQYEIRVTGYDGRVVYDEPVIVSYGYQNVMVRVVSDPNASQGKASTVSFKQLMHRVPPEAQKEFDKGRSAASKNDSTKALQHFEKAITIDPEFADAFNDLGTTYVALGQLPEAAQQFQKAVDLVPDHNWAVANLSIVLSKLGKIQEAGAAARRALKLHPGMATMRYILGLSLVRGNGDKKEALDNLERAAPEIPAAYLLVAKILEDTGRRTDAAKSLDAYLSSPSKNVNRAEIEAWLTELRN
jgi:tetratricopeptide (TPR) repeat protein